jgi:hypothetical protein
MGGATIAAPMTPAMMAGMARRQNGRADDGIARVSLRGSRLIRFQFDADVSDGLPPLPHLLLQATVQKPPDSRVAFDRSRVEVGSRERMAAIVSLAVSPEKLRRPVNISKRTHPNAHMSARRSTG